MKKPIWFKAKDFGWGWYPSTWQGWLILITYTIFLLYGTTPTIPGAYILEVGISTSLLVLICFFTGEKPEWRWGRKK